MTKETMKQQEFGEHGRRRQRSTMATNKEGDDDVVDDYKVYGGIEEEGDGGGQE